MITCSEAVNLLWHYLDNALSPEDYQTVESHLAFCRRCCGELEFAKELRQFLGSSAGEELPPDVQLRLERYLENLSEGGDS